MRFKQEILKSTVLTLVLYAGVSMANAATLTVGPHGQYASPCIALLAAKDGDTVLVDANHGIPYTEPADPNSDGSSDCKVTSNNLTIRGVNGRPILDAAGELIEKGIFVLDGHDILVDNFEFRNAQLIDNPNSSTNVAGIRIEDGAPGSPAGGNITLRRCYIHDNGDGVLSGNSGPGIGQWFSPNPFLLFEFDKFDHNGYGDGETHNMYIGYDGYLKMKFTLQYSESLNAYVGHTVKTRAPFNNILYNRIGDSSGSTSYILDFPLGGSTYVEGNVLFKSTTTNPNSNENFMIYRDVSDNTPSDPVYGPPNEDLHFLNNRVADDNPSGANAFVTLSCADPSTANCSVPANGQVLTTPAVIENNLFIGQSTQVTNQPNAVIRSNQIFPFSRINADRYMLP